MRPIREGLKTQNIKTFQKHHTKCTKKRPALLQAPSIKLSSFLWAHFLRQAAKNRAFRGSALTRSGPGCAVAKPLQSLAR
jgi:hypothetical protein